MVLFVRSISILANHDAGKSKTMKRLMLGITITLFLSISAVRSFKIINFRLPNLRLALALYAMLLQALYRCVEIYNNIDALTLMRLWHSFIYTKDPIAVLIYNVSFQDSKYLSGIALYLLTIVVADL